MPSKRNFLKCMMEAKKKTCTYASESNAKRRREKGGFIIHIRRMRVKNWLPAIYLRSMSSGSSLSTYRLWLGKPEAIAHGAQLNLSQQQCSTFPRRACEVVGVDGRAWLDLVTISTRVPSLHDIDNESPNERFKKYYNII